MTRSPVARLVDAAVDRFGQLDVYINNAGLAPNSPLDDLKVEDWEAMDNLLKAVTAKHGRLYIFMANSDIGEYAPLGKITEAQFDTVVGANFKGVLFSVQSAVALMQSGGAVVIIGSTGSVAPPAGMSVDGGPKAALNAALHSWVLDWAVAYRSTS